MVQVYDKEGMGSMHNGVLRDLFYEADVKAPDDEDIAILIGQMDKDKDGQVGLEDYRRLVGNVKKSKASPTGSPNSRRLMAAAQAQTKPISRLVATVSALVNNNSPRGEAGKSTEQRHISTFNSTMKQLDQLQRGNFSALHDPHEFLAEMRLLEGTPLLELIKKEILDAPELATKALAQMHIPLSPARKSGISKQQENKAGSQFAFNDIFRSSRSGSPKDVKDNGSPRLNAAATINDITRSSRSGSPKDGKDNGSPRLSAAVTINEIPRSSRVGSSKDMNENGSPRLSAAVTINEIPRSSRVGSPKDGRDNNSPRLSVAAGGQSDDSGAKSPRLTGSNKERESASIKRPVEEKASLSAKITFTAKMIPPK